MRRGGEGNCGADFGHLPGFGHLPDPTVKAVSTADSRAGVSDDCTVKQPRPTLSRPAPHDAPDWPQTTAPQPTSFHSSTTHIASSRGLGLDSRKQKRKSFCVCRFRASKVPAGVLNVEERWCHCRCCPTQVPQFRHILCWTPVGHSKVLHVAGEEHPGVRACLTQVGVGAGAGDDCGRICRDMTRRSSWT